MAVITELSEQELTQTLEQYDVGALVNSKAATDGIENTNYFVTTENGAGNEDFVLTLIEEAGDDEDHRASMVKILDKCHQRGLPVPIVVRTAELEPEGSLFGKPVILCRRLKGRHIDFPARPQCEAIGRFLARLHLVSQEIINEALPYVRDIGWLTDKTDLVKMHMAWMDRQMLQDAVESIISLLERNDVQSMPKGIIHADLFRDNALFTDFGLSGVVDFHHAGIGYWLYDIAVAVNDWCRHEDQLDENRVFGLLHAYHEIRPITKMEASYFPMFLLYAAIAFWLSRLMIAVRDDLPSYHPIKDPKEFEALVRRHLRTPYRIELEAL